MPGIWGVPARGGCRWRAGPAGPRGCERAGCCPTQEVRSRAERSLAERERSAASPLLEASDAPMCGMRCRMMRRAGERAPESSLRPNALRGRQPRWFGSERSCSNDQPKRSGAARSGALRSESAARRRRCLEQEMHRCAWDALPDDGTRKGKSAGIKFETRRPARPPASRVQR